MDVSIPYEVIILLNIPRDLRAKVVELICGYSYGSFLSSCSVILNYHLLPRNIPRAKRWETYVKEAAQAKEIKKTLILCLERIDYEYFIDTTGAHALTVVFDCEDVPSAQLRLSSTQPADVMAKRIMSEYNLWPEVH